MRDNHPDTSGEGLNRIACRPERELEIHKGSSPSMPSGSDDPRVAVIVVNYRTPDLTLRCLAALGRERALCPSLRVVVVDGGSNDGSAEKLGKALKQPEYLAWASLMPLSINGGFGWANNQAMLTLALQEVPPEFYHILNPDTEICPGAITKLVEALRSDPHCGAAGSQLLTSDSEPTASAFRFPSSGRDLIGAAQSRAIGSALRIQPIVVSSERTCDVDWVSGASVMLRAEALGDSGLFDDGFFLYFEEVELMHRLRRCGWSVRHVPASRVVHVEGAATGVGAAAVERPFPPYWYQSRRRYFELTGGKTALLAANLSSLAGLTVAGIKRMFGRPPASKALRARDLVKQGFWPSDRRPSIARLGDAPGRAPAWMARS